MPPLTIKTVPISSLVLDPANARKHPEKNLEAIRGSLTRFGQQKPIVVDSSNVVRAGNGTLEAAKSLGWTEIAVVVSDLTGAEMQAFAIADNRSAELATWDDEVLAATLDALASENFDTSLIGFSDADMDVLSAKLNQQGASHDDLLKEYAEQSGFNSDELAYRKVTVSFASEADAASFGKITGLPMEKSINGFWYPHQESEPRPVVK